MTPLEPRGLLAVDPGARACGAAAFEDGVLVAAAWVRVPADPDGPARAPAAAAAALAVARWSVGRHVQEVAVEWPQVYASRVRAGARGGDPNDLLPLAGAAAAVAALRGGARCSAYLPAEWKGQLPHEALELRVRARLSPEELAVLDAAAGEAGKMGAHNVVDAVGVGLHHLGRLGRRRAGLGG